MALKKYSLIILFVIPQMGHVVLLALREVALIQETDPSKLNVPTKVDVVMANPPYIRQEEIKDKKLSRKHLERIEYTDISERSDIYVYFFTHATEFLKKTGRIGFITSDKWLTTEYGEDLQEFFLDNFKIRAVIAFSKRVFEESISC